MNTKMTPKRKMNTKTQKVAKTIGFYMKNFQPSLKTILLFKKLQRKRPHLRPPGGFRRRQ